MSSFKDNLFNNIEKKSNIKQDDIYKVANSVKHADFSDEKTVRNLIRQLSRMANKPVSKEKEDKIVQSITKNNMPVDMQSLSKLFKK
ncbi:stage VI sporulation protein F [Virgibacillus phasianinus]|uniref:Stage VI sporulation protein F n=1 Tax=Virgibacillus phasianinus TaxID=2017483 RepID=A0A220U672_9BACI|nr:stage VI sporulation protein F [Virgibacillus phasianinus]ASK63331.1 stage VI sporulation protein F [Virgibacillus phasianinus]